MAIKVFYSLDYARDLQRLYMIGQIPTIEPSSPASLADPKDWKMALEAGETEIQKRIDEALDGTAVTVVFLGQETGKRIGIDYEIEQSLKRGNAMVGIQIHHLPDSDGERDQPGKAPRPLRKSGFKMYKYFDRHRLRIWIEESIMIGKRITLEQEHSSGPDASDTWGVVGEMD